MSFSENLRDLLDYKGIELKELSAGTGISKNTLDNYLSGQKSLPNIENGVKIAKFLGVSAEYLVYGNSFVLESQDSLEKIVSDLKKLNKTDFFSIANIVNSLAKNKWFCCFSSVNFKKNWCEIIINNDFFYGAFWGVLGCGGIRIEVFCWKRIRFFCFSLMHKLENVAILTASVCWKGFFLYCLRFFGLKDGFFKTLQNLIILILKFLQCHFSSYGES